MNAKLQFSFKFLPPIIYPINIISLSLSRFFFTKFKENTN